MRWFLLLAALALAGCSPLLSDTAQGNPTIIVRDDVDAGVRCYVWVEINHRGGISCVRLDGRSAP
jgi:hypothetical protein